MSYEQQAKLFKTLMHPARLAILDVLREGEECVCHLEAFLCLRQAYISQQLMVLRDAGLIQDRRDGWNIYYQVVRPEVFAVVDAAIAVTGGPVRQGTSPETKHACPCPKCSAASATMLKEEPEISTTKGE